MLNKLPIGQLANGDEVGKDGTANDQQNRNAMDGTDAFNLPDGGITLSRKRPRFSMVAMALNGPNLHELGTPFDIIGPVAVGSALSVDSASFRPAASPSMEFHYKMREPMVFLGGSLYIGINYPDTPSTTSISIYKNTTKIEERVFDNAKPVSAGAGGDIVQRGDILIDIPGGRTHFATDELFKFIVTPDSDSGDANTDGLMGVSALLWFKAQHVSA